MIRLIRNLVSFTCGFVLACTVSVCPASSTPQIIRIESVQVRPTQDGAVIEIRSDQPFTFVTYTLIEPDRLVIDPVEARVITSLSEKSSIDGKLIQEWQLFRGGDTDESPTVDYVSFLLTKPVEHRVESTAGKLVVHVRPTDQENSYQDRPSLDPYTLRPSSGQALSLYPLFQRSSPTSLSAVILVATRGVSMRSWNWAWPEIDRFELLGRRRPLPR